MLSTLGIETPFIHSYRQHVDKKVLLRTDAEFFSDFLHFVQKGFPEEVGIARRHAVKSRQNADQRRFASAVVSQKRGDLSLIAARSERRRGNLQAGREVVHSHDRLSALGRGREGLSDVIDLQSVASSNFLIHRLDVFLSLSPRRRALRRPIPRLLPASPLPGGPCSCSS